MGSTDTRVLPGTAELFADLHLDRLSGEKICAWAVSALEAGFDTESLRTLAGMSLEVLPSFFEARPYFMRALQELQLSLPSNREEALRAYVVPLNHPPDLMGWCYLWEGNAPDGTFAKMSEEDLERAAREFARTWLAGQ
jgi:hypothetical protein